MRTRVGAASFVCVMSFCASARASPVEELGFGARAPAMGGAAVASADAVTAAVYNPAAVAAGDRPEIMLGYGIGHLALDLDGRDPRLLDPRGLDLAGSVPLALGADWAAGVGFGLHLPDQFIARIQLLPATDPHFVTWDNRIHRIVVDVVAGIRYRHLLAFGAGLTLFADAAGHGLQFRVDSLPGRTVADAALDVALPIRAAPTLGLAVTPRPWLRFGARYTGELSLDLTLDIVALARIPGTSLAGDVIISVRGTDFYTPEQLAFGAEADAGPFTFAAELDYLHWSALPSLASDVSILIRLGVEPSILEAAFPSASYHDTVVPRLGVAWNVELPHRRSLVARAGWWFQPSPVPDQTGITSYADNDRHVATLGAGLTVRDLGPAITLELAGQAHFLVRRDTLKTNPFVPFGDFTSGGRVFYLAVALRAEL